MKEYKVMTATEVNARNKVWEDEEARKKDIIFRITKEVLSERGLLSDSYKLRKD